MGQYRYPPGTLCAFPGCGKLRSKRDWCATHWKRWYVHGDPSITLYKTGDDITSYITAHSRLRYHRGSASKHACMDCGSPAQHWSLHHGSPKEKVGISSKGKPIPFSPDPLDYEPRCVPCHKRYDAGG